MIKMQIVLKMQKQKKIMGDWIFLGEKKMKDMGYPQVEMKQDVQDLNYNLNSKKCLVIYNKIQTTKGQSKSPIFLEFYPNNQNQIPEYQLIGVHTGSN